MPSDAELPIDPDLYRATPRTGVDVLAAIAVGGALGSLARAGLGQIWRTAPGTFPATTLGVNLVGAFTLGVVLVVLIDLVGPTRRLRPFLVTGVLGGFTTFSTFMVESAQLSRHGHIGIALAYLVVATSGGLVIAFAGIKVGDAVVARARGGAAQGGAP